MHRHPNVRAVMNEQLAGLDNVALIAPLDYPHFARLLDISHIMLTDSGGVQDEAPALGKPVLVMRETTERPEGVEAGTALLVGTDPDRIVAETVRLLDDEAAYAAMARAHNPFGDGKSADLEFRVITLPDVLVLHLKRFEDHLRRRPEQVIPDRLLTIESTSFELRAVVTHDGPSPLAGH